MTSGGSWPSGPSLRPQGEETPRPGEVRTASGACATGMREKCPMETLDDFREDGRWIRSRPRARRSGSTTHDPAVITGSYEARPLRVPGSWTAIRPTPGGARPKSTDYKLVIPDDQ